MNEKRESKTSRKRARVNEQGGGFKVRFKEVDGRGGKERWFLVPFLARSKPKIPFLGLSLLRNQTKTLATQAKGPYA